MKNAIPIGAFVAAILVAFGLNKCEIPTEVAEVVTKTVTKQVVKRDTVYIPYKVENTVASTKYIDKIRVIRDSFYTLGDMVPDTSLAQALRKRIDDASEAAENIQNENELLMEDRNSLIDILAQTTDELWIERNKKDSITYKKFKHGLSASYGVLIGSKPIYQLTYEKPITPALSITGGVIWNGRPGVAVGVKIMF